MNYDEVYQFIKIAHQNQSRWEREPYYVHPKRISDNVRKYGGNEDSVIAALLHDVVEDCNMSLQYVQEVTKCSNDTKDIVDLLTRPDNTSRKAYMSRLINSGNIEAMLVKFFDAYDNSCISEEDKSYIATKLSKNWKDLKARYIGYMEQLLPYIIHKYPSVKSFYVGVVNAK